MWNRPPTFLVRWLAQGLPELQHSHSQCRKCRILTSYIFTILFHLDKKSIYWPWILPHGWWPNRIKWEMRICLLLAAPCPGFWILRFCWKRMNETQTPSNPCNWSNTPEVHLQSLSFRTYVEAPVSRIEVPMKRTSGDQQFNSASDWFSLISPTMRFSLTSIPAYCTWT